MSYDAEHHAAYREAQAEGLTPEEAAQIERIEQALETTKRGRART